MRKLFRHHQDLLFTAVASGLLSLVLLSFTAVRFTKASYARLLEGPRIFSVHPGAIVPGAQQEVTVLSERTHFGPRTSVHPGLPGVLVSGVRFVSEGELSFRILVQERKALGEGTAIPLTLRSPEGKGVVEDLKLELVLTREAEPLELDLFNVPRSGQVTVEWDYAMLGYRPRGFAPFQLTV
ncbi:MAG: hypothetical protein ACREKK_09545, partial [Candidatus Methylomirabilales bacterium]